MDPRRAETLEALSTYLQHQKTLLARTQADIERLKKLRAEALSIPEQFAHSQEKDHATPQLIRIEEEVSDLQDYHPAQSFPAKIDWEIFSACDTTPLRTLAIRARIDHTQRAVPSNTQHSPLSYLQKFVKDARKVILDPVLESLPVASSNPTVTFNPHINPLSSNDSNHISTLTLPPLVIEDETEDVKQAPTACDSLTTIHKCERSHAKIPHSKNRKVNSDLVVRRRLREEGTNDLLIPTDETARMDMRRQTPQSGMSTPPDGPLLQFSDSMNLDTAGAITLEDAAQFTKQANLPRTRQSVVLSRPNINSLRTRQPSLKLRTQSLTAPTENELSPASTLPISSQSLGKRCRDASETNELVRKPKTGPLTVSEVNAQTDKHKSETYKQAWSISEQHLLERLLEEIPDGERNRWAQISQAMGGRRTPRQVASRVQKYFEKLKRFGVGVESKGKTKS